MKDGLRCRVVCSQEGGFTRLDLIPLPGWIHLAHDEVVMEHLAMNSQYHISLSTWPVDKVKWDHIMARWNDKELIIDIDYVTKNGGAVLAWAGLGADPDMWEIYMSGSYAYKWRDGQYGLHISM